MIIIIILSILHIIAGIINYGATFAYFNNHLGQDEYAKIVYKDSLISNKCVAIIMALAGLFWFMPIIFLTDFYRYGLKFKS